IYRFSDQEYAISRSEDLDKLQTDLLEQTPSGRIARIHLVGRVEEDTFNYRQEVFRNLDQALGYLIIDDSNLGIRITRDKINKDFIEGSFPQQFLSELSDDEDALQLAYELVMEVKK
ncbi:MAG: DNA repair exonuclease, partial [Syntrophomonadaceae bacterium]|nr:DNA repair exonuclease [Syntrophomonadaceae bacterium]